MFSLPKGPSGKIKLTGKTTKSSPTKEVSVTFMLPSSLVLSTLSQNAKPSVAKSATPKKATTKTPAAAKKPPVKRATATKTATGKKPAAKKTSTVKKTSSARTSAAKKVCRLYPASVLHEVSLYIAARCQDDCSEEDYEGEGEA